MKMKKGFLESMSGHGRLYGSFIPENALRLFRQILREKSDCPSG